MADVVEKVRLHSDIIKGLSHLRSRMAVVGDVDKVQRVHDCEVRMVKARNDGELLQEIQAWLIIVGALR